MTGPPSAARSPGTSEPLDRTSGGTGELPSFDSIYEQYFDFVWASTRRLGVRPSALDDVVQEIFVVIHSRLHTLQQPAALRSWIYSIARRTVSTYHRAQRVRDSSGAELVAQAHWQASSPPTPLDVSEQNAQVKLLFNLMESLDSDKREIFLLVEVEQLTVPEAAEVLEIPLNTAYSRLRAARQAFETAHARHVLMREAGGRV